MMKRIRNVMDKSGEPSVCVSRRVENISKSIINLYIVRRGQALSFLSGPLYIIPLLLFSFLLIYYSRRPSLPRKSLLFFPSIFFLSCGAFCFDVHIWVEDGQNERTTETKGEVSSSSQSIDRLSEQMAFTYGCGRHVPPSISHQGSSSSSSWTFFSSFLMESHYVDGSTAYCLHHSLAFYPLMKNSASLTANSGGNERWGRQLQNLLIGHPSMMCASRRRSQLFRSLSRKRRCGIDDFEQQQPKREDENKKSYRDDRDDIRLTFSCHTHTAADSKKKNKRVEKSAASHRYIYFHLYLIWPPDRRRGIQLISWTTTSPTDYKRRKRAAAADI